MIPSTLVTSSFLLLSALLAQGEAVAKIKLNIPDFTTYRDYYNSTDFEWGGFAKEIEFSQAQIDDQFAIKFKWVEWGDQTEGQDYTRGSIRANMTCYAQAKEAYSGTAEWTLSRDKANRITGTTDNHARVWCPADQGDCINECVEVDSAKIKDGN